MGWLMNGKEGKVSHVLIAIISSERAEDPGSPATIILGGVSRPVLAAHT
jgi:hypothetical protein